MSSSGTGCLSCPDPIPQCSCSPGQFCQTIQRSCNRCAYNQCLNPSKGSSGSSGTNIGVSVGGAVGGIVGVALILALVYWFWWKPRGLAASRKRYSRHLEHRQSKLLQLKTQGGPATDRRDNGAPSPTSPALATKRTSVHLSMMPDGTGADRRLSRRGNSPSGDRRDSASLPTSVGATGGHSSRTSLESENPFGDHNRSSIGSYGDIDRTDARSARSSEFSFRSSHSTNIIPIAYIPPHSNSMALSDAQGSVRGAYGELSSDQVSGNLTGPRSPRLPQIRSSVPTSMASRDSLAPVNAPEDASIVDLINLHPLPPVLSPGSSSSLSFAALSTPAGAPIRPPRSPGLDLQLPKSSQPITSTPLSTPSQSVRNSIPLPMRPSSTSFLNSAPVSPVDRDRLSTITTATSRSGNSTMSYILDPPQIITPVNSQGLRRVDIVGRGQAGLVRLGEVQTAPTVTAMSTPDQSRTASSPKSQMTFAGGPPALGETVAHEDPFSDAAGVRTSTFSLGDVTGSQRRMRSESQDTVMVNGSEEDDGSADSFRLAQDNDSRWTVSSSSTGGELVALDPQPPSSRSQSSAGATGPGTFASGGDHSNSKTDSIASSLFDMPQSARSSQASLGSEGAAAPGIRLSVGDGPGEYSRANSFISTRSGATDSMSMLDGILFMASSIPDLPGPISPTRATRAAAQGASASPMPSSTVIDDSPPAALFPSPPPARTPSFVSRASAGPDDAAEDDDHEHAARHFGQQAGLGLGVSGVPDADSDEDRPLPAPFLPFAGQRPTSTASSVAGKESSTGIERRGGDRVQSQAMSVRSGFASGLSQIPFQLDGGLRDSMMMSLGADEDDEDDLREEQDYGRDDDDDRKGLAGTTDAAAAARMPSRSSGVSDIDVRSSWASGITDGSVDVDADELEGAVVSAAVRTPMTVTVQRSGLVKRGGDGAGRGESEEAQEQAVDGDAATVGDGAEDDQANPFGSHAEVVGAQPPNDRDSRMLVDHRGSMDSLALAAELSKNLEAEGEAP